jgi:hypothetical protein
VSQRIDTGVQVIVLSEWESDMSTGFAKHLVGVIGKGDVKADGSFNIEETFGFSIIWFVFERNTCSDGRGKGSGDLNINC